MPPSLPASLPSLLRFLARGWAALQGKLFASYWHAVWQGSSSLRHWLHWLCVRAGAGCYLELAPLLKLCAQQLAAQTCCAQTVEGTHHALDVKVDDPVPVQICSMWVQGRTDRCLHQAFLKNGARKLVQAEGRRSLFERASRNRPFTFPSVPITGPLRELHSVRPAPTKFNSQHTNRRVQVQAEPQSLTEQAHCNLQRNLATPAGRRRRAHTACTASAEGGTNAATVLAHAPACVRSLLLWPVVACQ